MMFKFLASNFQTESLLGTVKNVETPITRELESWKSGNYYPKTFSSLGIFLLLIYLKNIAENAQNLDFYFHTTELENTNPFFNVSAFNKINSNQKTLDYMKSAATAHGIGLGINILGSILMTILFTISRSQKRAEIKVSYPDNKYEIKTRYNGTSVFDIYIPSYVSMLTNICISLALFGNNHPNDILYLTHPHIESEKAISESLTQRFQFNAISTVINAVILLTMSLGYTLGKYLASCQNNMKHFLSSSDFLKKLSDAIDRANEIIGNETSIRKDIDSTYPTEKDIKNKISEKIRRISHIILKKSTMDIAEYPDRPLLPVVKLKKGSSEQYTASILDLKTFGEILKKERLTKENINFMLAEMLFKNAMFEWDATQYILPNPIDTKASSENSRTEETNQSPHGLSHLSLQQQLILLHLVSASSNETRLVSASSNETRLGITAFSAFSAFSAPKPEEPGEPGDTREI